MRISIIVWERHTYGLVSEYTVAFNDTIVFIGTISSSPTQLNLHSQSLTHFSSPPFFHSLPSIHLADAQQKRLCSNLILSPPFQLSCDDFVQWYSPGPPRPSNQYSLFSCNLGKNVFTIWQIIFLAYHTHIEKGRELKRSSDPSLAPGQDQPHLQHSQQMFI